MSLLLLLLLTLVCMPDDWRDKTPSFAPQSPVWSLTFTSLGVAAMSLSALAISAATRRALRRDPSRADRTIRRYRSLRLYHFIALLLFYGAALTLLGWALAVQHLGPYRPPNRPQLFPAAELLLLAPFLVSLLLSWACYYDVERALHRAGPSAEPFWHRGAYVAFHLRQNLALVLVPVLLLVFLKAIRWTFDGLEDERLVEAAILVALAVVFVGLPWVLRLVLRLKPMPAGPLRDRLLAAARRLNFRCSDVLLWNTRGGVANAMVAGILPFIRYVVFTDRLVSDLTPEEVEAVFGHEVGHVKHRHMLFYLGFLMLSLFVIGGLWELGAAYLAPAPPAADLAVAPDRPGDPDETAHASLSPDLAAMPLIGVLGAYIFVVFGFLSRRCERQADVFGCRAVSCARADCPGHDAGAVLAQGGHGLCPAGIRTFIDALEKVARLNGIPREKPGWLQSWQHSTIARRVDFLQHVLAQPALEARFQRRVRWIKTALLAALLGSLLLLGYLTGEWTRFFAHLA